MARVYIVRHGNTFDQGDVILRVGGRTDLPLSISGQMQAEALGSAFADLSFDYALISPLERTRMTAEAILSRQSSDIEVTLDERLIEVDYGPDEGKAESDVVARLGKAALNAWDQDAIVPQDWKVDPDMCRKTWGEILSDAIGTGLIVTSNGVARFVLDIVKHDNVARKLKTGAYGILDGEGRDWQVVAWNLIPEVESQ